MNHVKYTIDAFLLILPLSLHKLSRAAVCTLTMALVACNSGGGSVTVDSGALPSIPIEDIRVTSGIYGIGDPVDIQVTLSEPVTLDSTSQVSFTFGGTTRTISYVSGSGTNELVFRYTVVSGDNVEGIEVTEIVGSVEKYVASTPIRLVGVKLDGIAPQATGVSAAGTYGANAPVAIAVTFDELVQVTGTPQLELTVDTRSGEVQTRQAYYTSGSNSNVLTFTYTVNADDQDSNGIPVAFRFDDTSGITDEAGNAFDANNERFTLDANLILEGARTGIERIQVTAGRYTTGNILLTLVYSASVSVNTTGGNPELRLTVGTDPTVVTAAYDASNTSGRQVAFNYTVRNGDNGAIEIQGLTVPEGSGIVDVDTNGEVTNNIPAEDLGVIIDTKAPTISTVSAPAKVYTVGETIDIAVMYSEDVTVDTANPPRLTLTVGDTEKTAEYIPGNDDDTTLVFRYTVATGDDTDVVEVKAIGTGVSDMSGIAADNTIPSGQGPLAQVLIDTIAPKIIGVTADAGSYAADASIAVQVRFDETVHVTGTPQVALTVGEQAKTADYISGSGTDTLTFNYPIVAGDDDADGIAVTALELNGGTIVDRAGIPANNDLNGQWLLTDVRVDTSAPVIDDVTADTNTYAYAEGANIPVRVRFDDIVDVDTTNGIPQLLLTIGQRDTSEDASKTAAYASGSGTDTLIFNYPIDEKDEDTDGIEVTGVNLNDGTIQNKAGYDAFTEATTAFPSAYRLDQVNIDSTQTVVTAVDTDPVSGTYRQDQTIEIKVSYNKPVSVTGEPQLTLDIGGATKEANYSADSSDSTTLVFRYTIGAGDTDADGIAVTALDLNGGSIVDASTRQSVDNGNVPTFGNTSVLVDTAQPHIDSISTSSRTYRVGDAIDITVTYNETVAVTGTPQLTVTVGDTSGKTATYVSGSDSAALVFRYTVEAGDNDADGIEVTAVNVNGGTIADTAGNPADNALNGQGTLTATIDTTAPTVTGIAAEGKKNSERTVDGDFLIDGDTIEITLTYDEAVVVDTTGGMPQLVVTLETGEVNAQYQSVAQDGTEVVFRYVIGANDRDVDGIEVTSLALHGGTIGDAAGNNAGTDISALNRSFADIEIYQANTVTFTSSGPLSATYGDTQLSNNAACATGVPTYATEDSAQINLDSATGVFGIIAVGDGSATATARCAGDEDSGYYGQTASYGIDIAKATLSLSFSVSSQFELLYTSTTPTSGPSLRYADLVNSGDVVGGTVTYESDNTAIVVVDAATGDISVASGVTVDDAGSRVPIRVNLRGAANYADATASYTVVLIAQLPISTVPFSAWVSSNKAQLDFPDGVTGSYELYSSRDPDCDIDTYASCTSGRMNILSEFPRVVETPAWTLTTPGYYVLKDENSNRIARRKESFQRFSARRGHQLVVLHDTTADTDYMYLIGGNDGNLKNDVWRSSDGIEWIEVTANAAFSARTEHQVVVVHDATADTDYMYLIGGNDGSLENDVWRSSDGATWTEVTTDAAFSARTEHQVVVVHDTTADIDYMYLIGGNDGSYKNDVWRSWDGITWSEVTTGAGFSARQEHHVVVFNEKMYLTGGRDAGRLPKGDVWSSVDGVTWTQDVADASFGQRQSSGIKSHQVVVFGDGMYVIAGNTPYDNNANDATSDVWYSKNGTDWERKSHLMLPRRTEHQAVVLNHRFYVIGGATYTFVPDIGESALLKDDVWRSDDGVFWLSLTDAAFSPRFNHQVVVLHDTTEDMDYMYLIGGRSFRSFQQEDVWRSSNGVDWTRDTANAGFAGRRGSDVVAFKGRIYLIGGQIDDTRVSIDDVWRSSDGKNWTQDTADAGFPARYHHQVVVFNERMYLIGGRFDVRYENDQRIEENTSDVWYSSDGRTWIEATNDAGFSARYNHQVVVFNSRMYLIGGNDGSNKNDVWSSSDGVTWTENITNAAFPARSNYQVVVFKDKMYLIGGYDGSPKNDVWSSSDGTTWSQETADAAFAVRTGHQVVVFKERMYVIGGTSNPSDFKQDTIGNYNDVWRSLGGIVWERGVATNNFTLR